MCIVKQVRAPNGIRMGSFLDSIEHDDEGDKYIFATSLITLIGFIADKPVITVANYLRKSYFSEKVFSYYYLRDKKCYSKDMHKEAYGFDLNTKELLAECHHSFGFSDRYMTFKREHELDFDFYYLKDELQAIDCIKSLNIDFSLEWEAESAQSKWNDEVEKPIFRLSDSSHFENLNDEKVINGIRGLGLFRDKLIKLDTYSVLNAACLLSGDSPTEIHKFQDHLEFVQVFSEYISYKLMIELAIKDGELHICEDKILATGLKEYLGRNGYFFKGFNDFMAIEPAKPLIDEKSSEDLESSNHELKEAQTRIADLESQLAEKVANASFMMGTPTVEQGEPRDSEQIISDLKKQIKQLTADHDQAQTTIAELKEQLNIANTTLTNTKSVSIAQPFDWQNMSEHIYPPELHLALMVWQRIYWDNELKDSHITSHNGKFEAIAKKINLNPKSTLGKRVRMVINTAHTKKKQSELAEQLQAIDHINISAN